MAYGAFRKPLFRCLVLLLAMGVLLPLLGTDCSAAATRTVRVGYPELPGFITVDHNGQYSGYGYDLLQEIANYTSWDYEFIPTPYSAIQESLDDGTIDVFVPYQKTEERAKIYEYSQDVFCTNQATLLTSPDADLYYNDFSHFDGMVIGAAADTRNGYRFQEYLASQGCSVTLKNDYLNIAEMTDALAQGEIDAFVSGSNRGVSNCKIICTLDQTQSYLLAKKGNTELMAQFDAAIEKIQQNSPLLASQLDKKYHVPASGSYPSLTRDEAEYIAARGPVTIMVDQRDIDADTGELTRATKTVLDMISQKTGLTFRAVTADSLADSYRQFTDGAAELYFAFDSDYDWAREHNAWLTTEYASFSGIIAQKNSTATPGTIAVVKGSYIENYLKNSRTYSLVECDTYEDGLALVKSGKADGIILGKRTGNYYAALPQNSALTFTSMYDFSENCCIAVSQSSDNLLVDIIDKAVQSIPASEMNAAFADVMFQPQDSFLDYMYENPAGAVVLLTVTVAILVSLFFSLAIVVLTRRQNRRLVAANRAKTEFLSRMSHDMRTPLNGILGLTTLMRDETDPEVLHGDLNQLNISGQYLLNLINDTLDVSRIEQGRMELHPAVCDSREAMTATVNLIRPNLQAKHITLIQKVDIPDVRLFIDAGRLEQLLMNILGNAAKFTPEGGEVAFTLECLARDAEALTVRTVIRDSGIGMSPEFLPHIFEPFSQEDSGTTSRTNGTGLGMTICKQIVELMGGTISVKSQKGAGTEFTFTLKLPLATPEQIKAAALPTGAGADTAALEGTRVLLCEDNEINANIATLLLEKKGVRVDWAHDGREGCDRYTSEPPFTYAAILMDIRMPIMDGLTATRTIRASGREDAGSIPILAMTANAFEEDVRETREAGMDAHISKPIDVELLYNTLAKLIAERGSA